MPKSCFHEHGIRNSLPSIILSLVQAAEPITQLIPEFGVSFQFSSRWVVLQFSDLSWDVDQCNFNFFWYLRYQLAWLYYYIKLAILKYTFSWSIWVWKVFMILWKNIMLYVRSRLNFVFLFSYDVSYDLLLIWSILFVYLDWRIHLLKVVSNFYTWNCIFAINLTCQGNCEMDVYLFFNFDYLQGVHRLFISII